MTGTPPRKRIVLCMGAYCNAENQALDLHNLLRERLGDTLPAFMARGPVHWEIATCLDMCGGGPNLVLYPGEVWSHRTDVAKLRAFLDAHLGAADQD
ncbi:MAG: (2Fe-2S) ferredoxin domain-containing protein [Anaerolineae bacterium]|nr:(2Fe-2S) ferredoxin domain-containing protein [Anaerolineae bacterium]